MTTYQSSQESSDMEATHDNMVPLKNSSLRSEEASQQLLAAQDFKFKICITHLTAKIIRI
jgi:hypothetical protein